jgi:hypothetical protein
MTSHIPTSRPNPTQIWPPNPHRANLIRIYYYDGIADPKDSPEDHFEQREYFESLEKDDKNLEVSLGEAGFQHVTGDYTDGGKIFRKTK